MAVSEAKQPLRIVTVSEEKRFKFITAVRGGHSPTDASVRSGVTVVACNGRGRWPKATALF